MASLSTAQQDATELQWQRLCSSLVCKASLLMTRLLISRSCATLSPGRLLDHFVTEIWWIGCIQLQTAAPCQIQSSVSQLNSCAASEGSLWHMVPFVMSDDKPYPACKWRQSGGHAKSVHEALLYDRPFCSACYHYMPAHVLGDLSDARIGWKSR